MAESTYRAVVCEELGLPERLHLRRLPRAPLGPGTVRLLVKAAGINFPDVLTIQGLYQHRPELPFVPGVEVAGIVAEAAADVRGIAVGDAVIAQVRTGGYAEEAIAQASRVRPLPAGFSFAEGATLLVAHTTAYHALVTRAAIAPGQTLLVLGAAGGVGLAAVQLGKVLGARVLAAASSAEKLEVAGRYGADALIDYTRERVEDGVRRLTANAGADVVLDPVGIAQEAALRCVAPDGKLLIAGFAGGSIPAYAANRILLKGCTVIGVRAGEAGRRDPAMRTREHDALLTLAAQGLARPFVSQIFPLEGFAEAMLTLQERRAIGRIALATSTR
jgi:NADPH:quinone reductase